LLLLPQLRLRLSRHKVLLPRLRLRLLWPLLGLLLPRLLLWLPRR
jgi:hypothetical protein